ncbi:MAG: penicillin-binding protein 2 [Humibacillus sp.]
MTPTRGSEPGRPDRSGGTAGHGSATRRPAGTSRATPSGRETATGRGAAARGTGDGASVDKGPRVRAVGPRSSATTPSATASRATGSRATASRGSVHRDAAPATRGTRATAGTPGTHGRGPALRRSSAPRPPRRPRRRLKISTANPRRRARVMFAVIIGVLTVFAAQLLRVQAFDASATQAAAFNKRNVTTLTPALRGQILDTNGQVLAGTVERYTIAANPKAVPAYSLTVDGKSTDVGVAGAAAALSPLLDMSVADLTPILTRPKTLYAIIKKEVNPSVYREIRALGIPGISGEKTVERTYPTGMAAGEIVGFQNQSDPTISAGVERMLNSTLAGTPGRTVAERARDGYVIPGSQRVDTPVVNGRDVTLTIDADLQWYAQNALAKQVSAVGAESGTAVVIEVATGKIRASASYPTYDSNAPAASKSNLANRPFWEAFEPGSTGKLMTMAAALEEKVITPDTGVIVPPRLPRAGVNFKDNEPHGVENMTATGVIAKSSNMGTMLIGERVSPATMEGYYRKFGVGARTPVNFPGESAGQLAPSAKWNAPQRYTVLFGQGYSVTSVQATSVFATIANKGVRVPPSLIESTQDATGVMVPVAATTPVRVVSEDTSTKLSRMMEEVTGKDGTASAARIKGYRVAGKTGTADRYSMIKKGYDGFTASFVGYAPAENPKYAVGVFVQKPTAGMFGGMLAGPVFNQIMTYLLERTGAPPSPPSVLDYHVWATKPLSENDPTVFSNARAKRDGL